MSAVGVKYINPKSFRAPTIELPDWISVSDDLLTLFSTNIRRITTGISAPAGSLSARKCRALQANRSR